MKKWIWGAFAPLILCACSSLPMLAPEPKPFYDLDLHGTLDGVAWDGMAVGEIGKTHQITIESRTDVNYFVIETCHRWNKYEDVIKPSSLSHWNGNNSFTWQYDLAPGVEDTGLCVLRLYAYSKQVGAGQAYGLIIFKSPDFTLSTENICNGSDGDAHGTTVCKSWYGLVERLRFKEQVIAAPPGPDGTNVSGQCEGKFIDAATWEYKLPRGECISVFGSITAPHKFHVHLAYGFDKTQYRGSP